MTTDSVADALEMVSLYLDVSSINEPRFERGNHPLEAVVSMLTKMY